MFDWSVHGSLCVRVCACMCACLLSFACCTCYMMVLVVFLIIAMPVLCSIFIASIEESELCCAGGGYCRSSGRMWVAVNVARFHFCRYAFGWLGLVWYGMGWNGLWNAECVAGLWSVG